MPVRVFDVKIAFAPRGVTGREFRVHAFCKGAGIHGVYIGYVYDEAPPLAPGLIIGDGHQIDIAIAHMKAAERAGGAAIADSETEACVKPYCARHVTGGQGDGADSFDPWLVIPGHFARLCRRQLAKQRAHLFGKTLQLRIAFFQRAGAVQHKMPHACGMEISDALRTIGRGSQHGVSLRSGAEIHGVTLCQMRRRQIKRAFIGIVDAHEDQMAAAEFFQISLSLFCGYGDFFQAVAVHFGGYHIGYPAIGQTSAAFQRGFGAPASPDWRTAGRNGAGQHLNVLERIEFAFFIADRLAGPQFPDGLDAIGQTCAAFFYRHAAGGIFVGKFTADANAKNKPAFA